MIVSRTLAIGGAIAARAGLMLVLSALVYARATPEQGALFFQILFLQGIVIAFLSAAGFFRAQGLKAEAVESYLAGMLLMALPSVALPVGAALVLPAYAAEGAALFVMWLGAVCAALAAPLSSLVMQARGPWAAFLPAMAGAGLAAAALALGARDHWDGLLPYLALAGFQAVTFAGLAVQMRGPLGAALGRIARRDLGPVWAHLRETAGVGAVNVAHLLALFALREVWAGRAEAEIVAAVFLMLRLSDTALQLVQMVLSGYGVAIRLFEARRAPVVFGGMALGAAVALGGLGALGSAWPVLLLALAMQVAVDVLRLPWSLGYLYQMTRFDLRRYALFTLTPPLMALVLGGWMIWGGRPVGMQAVALIVTVTGATVSLWHAQGLRQDEGR